MSSVKRSKKFFQMKIVKCPLRFHQYMCWLIIMSLSVVLTSFVNCLWPLIFNVNLISPDVIGIMLLSEAPEPLSLLLDLPFPVEKFLLLLLLHDFAFPYD